MGECRPSRRSARALDILDLADQAVTSAVTPITSKENVTREQWRVLTLLDAAGDHESGAVGEATGRAMGEIAARAGVPNPTATRIVDRLVADGLAYRRSAPDDRRRVLVHISAAGHELVDRVAATLDDTLGTVLADLDPADRLDILDVLHRLVDTAASAPGRGAARSTAPGGAAPGGAAPGGAAPGGAAPGTAADARS